MRVFGDNVRSIVLLRAFGSLLAASCRDPQPPQGLSVSPSAVFASENITSPVIGETTLWKSGLDTLRHDAVRKFPKARTMRTLKKLPINQMQYFRDTSTGSHIEKCSRVGKDFIAEIAENS